MFDIIGDIHGEGDILKNLLIKMGYIRLRNTYIHPFRKAIFVGDIINRGDKIEECLQIVSSMILANSGFCILGNHEFDLLRYHYLKGTPALRTKYNSIYSRLEAKLQKTLLALKVDSFTYNNYINWIFSLPLWIDTGRIRVVHAAWHQESIETLSNALINRDIKYLIDQSFFNKDISDSLKYILKGRHIRIPRLSSEREFVVKWWCSIRNLDLKSNMLKDMKTAPNFQLDAEDLKEDKKYPSDSPPVFFGHYGMHLQSKDKLKPIANNLACVDINHLENKLLVAYRWSGEYILNKNNFIYQN